MVVAAADNLNCHNMDNDPNHVPTNAIVVNSKMVCRILALAIEAASIVRNGGMLLGVEEVGAIEVTWLKTKEEVVVVVVVASLTVEAEPVIIMEAEVMVDQPVALLLAKIATIAATLLREVFVVVLAKVETITMESRRQKRNAVARGIGIEIASRGC